MSDNWDCKVDVLDMYVRLHYALDVDDLDDLAQEISNVTRDLALKFKSDTGITVGKALGWDKLHKN